jgi:hypothetical protein
MRTMHQDGGETRAGRRRKTVRYSLALLVTAVLIIVARYRGDRILETIVQYARDQYRLHKSSTLSDGSASAGAYMYLSAGEGGSREKLVAYTNGSLALSRLPYTVESRWRIDGETEWRTQHSLADSEYVWGLSHGYLPVVVTTFSHRGLRFETKMFCRARSDAGTLEIGGRLLKVQNLSDRAVRFFHECQVRFDNTSRSLPMPTEQGFVVRQSPTPYGTAIEFGQFAILEENAVPAEGVEIRPGDSLLVSWHVERRPEVGSPPASPRDLRSDLGDAERYWQSRFGPLSARIPECEEKSPLLASIMQILMAGPGEVMPTVEYRTAFIRDGAMIVHALNVAGFTELSREQILYYADHPWASAFGPEADAPGEFVWMVSDYYKETGDRPFVQRLWPIIRERAGVILAMLRADPSYEVQGQTVVVNENGGIFGRMDGELRPIYPTVWLLAGLREAAQLAHEVDDRVLEKEYRSEFARHDSLFRAFCINNVGRLWNEDRGFVAGVHPTGIFSPKADYVQDLYNRHWPATGRWQADQWPYFDIAQAHAYLLLGQRERSDIIYEAVKQKYHGSQWGLFYEGDREKAMPHLWAAAEAFCFLYAKATGERRSDAAPPGR